VIGPAYSPRFQRVLSSVQAIEVKIREVFRIWIYGSSALTDGEAEVCTNRGKISVERIAMAHGAL